jgi:hypothetical protein
MAEILTLTTPIATSRTTYIINSLYLDWQTSAIVVRLVGSDGVELQFSYGGNEAIALMTILNTSNLTTTSLYKRVLQKLQADGKLPAGTITGTP